MHKKIYVKFRMVFFGTLQGNAQGTAQGNMQGTLQGSAQGTAQGNFQGTLQGNAQGTAQGNMQGTLQGNAQGTAQGNFQGTMQGYMQGYNDGYCAYAGSSGYSGSSASGNIRAWRSLDGGSQNIAYYEAQGNQGQGFCYFYTSFGYQHSAAAVFTGYSVQNTQIQQNGGVGIPSVAGTWQGTTYVFWTGTQRAGLRQGSFGLTIIGP